MQRLVSGCCWLVALLTMTGICRGEPRRYALVVGVREYTVSRNLPLLEYTEPDASEIAAILKQSGFQVTLMTQAASEGASNRRFAPSSANIRKQFQDLVETPFLTKEDCVLLVLGGHGIQLPAKNDAERQTYYFCPSDASIEGLKHSDDVNALNSLLSVQELYDTLKNSEAGVKLLVVDACRNDPNKPSAFRSANSVTRPPVPVPPGGIAALFSCSATEEAVEDSILKHGVFSYYLIEGLKGAADLDKDQHSDINELHKYVGSRTFDHVRQQHNRRQLPELKGEIQGWAPLLSLATPRPVTSTPTPMPLPNLNKLAVGTKAGEVCTLGGIKFCWCPSGNFQMGSPASEKDRYANENQVNVAISQGFWLGQYEVTQSEWKKIMGTTIEQQHAKNGEAKGRGAAHPMYHVSWDEATEFCRKLTTQERTAGRLPPDWEYTLPTEAQWEYACRAGTTMATAFGDKLDSTQANFDGDYPYNSAAEGEDKGQTMAVGSYQANAWNLYDMGCIPRNVSDQAGVRYRLVPFSRLLFRFQNPSKGWLSLRLSARSCSTLSP